MVGGRYSSISRAALKSVKNGVYMVADGYTPILHYLPEIAARRDTWLMVLLPFPVLSPNRLRMGYMVGWKVLLLP